VAGSILIPCVPSYGLPSNPPSLPLPQPGSDGYGSVDIYFRRISAITIGTDRSMITPNQSEVRKWGMLMVWALYDCLAPSVFHSRQFAAAAVVLSPCCLRFHYLPAFWAIGCSIGLMIRAAPAFCRCRVITRSAATMAQILLMRLQVGFRYREGGWQRNFARRASRNPLSLNLLV